MFCPNETAPSIRSHWKTLRIAELQVHDVLRPTGGLTLEEASRQVYDRLCASLDRAAFRSDNAACPTGRLSALVQLG